MIKKKRKVWIFGGWLGNKYSDNTKAMFEHCIKKDHDIKCIWITKNKRLAKEITKSGRECYYFLSVKGIHSQLISSKVFITHSVYADLLPSAISGSTLIYQMWHGLPLKKIMYDAIDVNLVRNVLMFIFPYFKHRFSYLITIDSEIGRLMEKAFRAEKNQVIYAGLPRNDLLKLKSIRSDRYKVIYMPTFRGGVGSEFNLFDECDFDFERYDQLFSNEGIEFVIRLHPVNKLTERNRVSINSCNSISISIVDDIYSELQSYDCLVTDFSSIYFDFLLTRKPIIFLPLGLENYLKNDRALYYDYDELTFPPRLLSWDSLVVQIIHFKKNHMPNNYKKNYNNLFLKVHGSLDAVNENSSEKIYKEII